jgi:dTDP-4-dehydrorhamnose 3,5-epimerase
MIVNPTNIPGVLEIEPQVFADARGRFIETWHGSRYESAGITSIWVQDNQSHTVQAGTIRGLHLQIGAAAQAKLVTVCHGIIFAVVVDLRWTSATYRRWVGLEVSAQRGNQLFVPRGFAHGFLTLENDCIVNYKVDAPYAVRAERVIRWDDPDIAIEWPCAAEPILSEKDAAAPRLDQLDVRMFTAEH